MGSNRPQWFTTSFFFVVDGGLKYFSVFPFARLSFWGCGSSSSSWHLQAFRSPATGGNFAGEIPIRDQTGPSI